MGCGESRYRARAGWPPRYRRSRSADSYGRRAQSRNRGGHPRGRVRPQSRASLPRAQVTPTREALVLPTVFLTATLIGGLRFGPTVLLLPPSLFALVLSILLLRLLIQSGALAPERLLSPSRTVLANVNGSIVLLTLWVASAQTFALMIPETGLPRLAFNVFFLILLLNTAAANPDRRRLLRS